MPLPKWEKSVNSSTFSSDRHRRYVKWLYGVVFSAAYALYALGIYLEPLYGDLTRVGSFDERTFGWQQPQTAFTTVLFTQDGYRRYHDVVVLGDSFSLARPTQQWQNHLVQATGWSLVTLNVDDANWEKLVDSQVYRDTPPKVLILQSVERAFPKRIKAVQNCEAAVKAQPFDSMPIRSALAAELRDRSAVNSDKPTKTFKRPQKWSDVKLGFVFKYLWNKLLREGVGIQTTRARKIVLSRDAPFSSLSKRQMLVYKEDVVKGPAWRELTLPEMDCRIERIRRKVEANGKTRFVLMITPDKLTAYQDFVADRNLRELSLLSALSARHPDVIPRTDVTLTEAIRAGEGDVYLPDDTHWGAAGQRTVAGTVLDFLRTP